MAERRIVESATGIVHVSVLERDDMSVVRVNGYEATLCSIYLNGRRWHATNRNVTCLMCLCGEDYS